MFQLTGDTSKLNDNVNKEVEVTGNVGSSETSSNTSGQSSLNVTDVRKVADTCSSPGAGSEMPQSATPPSSSPSTPPSSANPPSTSKPPSSSQPPSGPSDPDQDPAATQSATPQSATPQSATPQSTTPQTGAATPEQNANPNANPNESNAENAQGKAAKKGGALPQTASPLPLMGLLGFGSLLSGMIVRRKK